LSPPPFCLPPSAFCPDFAVFFSFVSVAMSLSA
jgi:hypothetical protein